MKKVLCFLLALLMLAGTACADTSLITGEVVEIPIPGDLRILVNSQAMEASFNDTQVYGAVQEDGTLLLGTREKVIRLAQLPDMALFSGLFDRLEQQPTYAGSIYSSLFTQAQKIELTADEVCSYALALLGICPLLDPDGQWRQAAGGSYGKDTWATVTRYQADPSQYPDTWMLVVNVFSPVLPQVRVQFRQDGYGNEFEIAVSPDAVSDWDETVLAIEDDSTGATGYVIRGFSMIDDNGSEPWTYVEISGYGFTTQWQFALDLYRDAEDARRWHVSIEVTDMAARAPIAKAELSSEGTDMAPLPLFDGALIVDGTDGLDAEERAQLGL